MGTKVKQYADWLFGKLGPRPEVESQSLRPSSLMNLLQMHGVIPAVRL